VLASNAVLAAPSPPLNTAGLCGNSDYYEQIRSLWFQLKPEYQKWVTDSADSPYNLYYIQGETNNLLKYTGHCQDLYILDELATLYLGAIDTLDKTDDYIFYYYPDWSWMRCSSHKLPKKHQMWLDDTGLESILVSSQFLYLISDALNIIIKIEPEQQTPEMQNMIDSYPEILLAHYDRWIFNNLGPFQVRGWGCKVNGKYVKSGMNHLEFIEKKMNRHLGDLNSPSYCNSVTDTDMWIIAGATNLTAMYQSNIKFTPITPEKYRRFAKYIRTGVELLKSRVTYRLLQDWDGKPVQGANFDLGAWDDHPAYEYAGCKATIYPKHYIDKKIKFKIKGVGWDLSHARRFVHVFDTLYENNKITGLGFPDKIFMNRLSNQFLYGAFNGDFSKPLFTNFIDGTNGWYRVGYEKRIGFGYGLWDMSISALTGGFSLWSRYNNNYGKLYCALVEMLNSNKPEVQKHVEEHYEKNHWNNYKRSHSIDFQKQSTHVATQHIVIQLLPSLCFSKQANKCEHFH